MATVNGKEEESHPRGNLNRFDGIYQQFHKAVYANIIKLVHDETLAQDIFQDTFLSLWDHLNNKPEKENIASWLFVVSHNKSKACLRSRLKESLLLVENYNAFETAVEETEDPILLETQLHLIGNAVEKLSPRRRLVFTLNKFEGKSIEEIAAEMNSTPGTIREYLKQAVRIVRQQVVKEKGLVEGAALVLWMISPNA
ncbi:MAG: sigma-70 family RNA polymerase sigma factor [Chitinophagaceae bacterium]